METEINKNLEVHNAGKKKIYTRPDNVEKI